LRWLDQLKQQGAISTPFNWGLLTFGASSRPETAGLGVALIGSAYMMLIVLVLSLPIGVAASIYLEEFAPKNRWTDLIEVNIANLAAVPSIVFGILGLAVFINFAGLPQSAPIVGGLVLTLMTLPRIIIPARAALKSVPESLYEAASIDGASALQKLLFITLPMMRNIIMITILYSLIVTFADFDIVRILTNGGPQDSTHLFATYAFTIGIQSGNIPRGAAVSLFMFPILALVAFFVLRSVFKRNKEIEA
jgi:phosphate transport system permease protein